MARKNWMDCSTEWHWSLESDLLCKVGVRENGLPWEGDFLIITLWDIKRRIELSKQAVSDCVDELHIKRIENVVEYHAAKERKRFVERGSRG